MKNITIAVLIVLLVSLVVITIDSEKVQIGARGIQGDMSLAAGENHVGQFGGNITRVSGVFVRPSDTVTYTVGDLIGTITTTATLPVTVTGACRVSGGSGYVRAMALNVNQKSITPPITVTLFNSNAATLSADNAAYQTKYADVTKVIGNYSLAALKTHADATNSDESFAYDATMHIPFICATGQTSIWYVLSTGTDFVPASGASFTLSLWIENN